MPSRSRGGGVKDLLPLLGPVGSPADDVHEQPHAPAYDPHLPAAPTFLLAALPFCLRRFQFSPFRLSAPHPSRPYWNGSAREWRAQRRSPVPKIPELRYDTWVRRPDVLRCWTTNA